MKLLWTDLGWENYCWWQANDARIIVRINELLKDVRRNPFNGIGHPEPLRNELKGWWSRRITEEHRLIYRIVGKGDEQAVEISACRFHYRG